VENPAAATIRGPPTPTPAFFGRPGTRATAAELAVLRVGDASGGESPPIYLAAHRAGEISSEAENLVLRHHSGKPRSE